MISTYKKKKLKRLIKVEILSYSVLILTSFMAMFSNMQYAKAEDYCDNVSNNAELTNCGQILHAREDAAMTLIYKQLIESFKQEDKDSPINGVSRSGSREEALREAQRAWINYRDKDCAYESLVLGNGGTISSSLQWGCLATLTKNRAIELQKMLNRG